MTKILIVLSLLLAGCQAWQPYAAIYPTAAATPTQTQTNPTPTPQSVCIVAAQALHLRAGAGTTAAVIDWLAAGQILTRTGNQRGAWYEVTTGAGLRGWVHSNYCK